MRGLEQALQQRLFVKCNCDDFCLLSLSLLMHTHSVLYRETVSSDFTAACLFLKDHMDNMDNPNDDMVSCRDSSTETNNQT